MFSFIKGDKNMSFNPKKTHHSFEKSLLTSENFTKFLDKYSSDTQQRSTDVSYLTSDNKRRYFSPVLMSKSDPNGDEFNYFLAQTLPFHRITDSQKKLDITLLAYIQNSNGTPQQWCNNSLILLSFVNVGHALKVIPLYQNNGKYTFTRYPGIKAITHSEKERTHTDD